MIKLTEIEQLPQNINSTANIFNLPYNYQYCFKVSLVHAIITSVYGKENWVNNLRKFLENDNDKFGLAISATIKKYAPVALAMNEIFQKLRDECSKTKFQNEYFAKFLSAIR